MTIIIGHFRHDHILRQATGLARTGNIYQKTRL